MTFDYIMAIKALRRENADLREKLDVAETRTNAELERFKMLAKENAGLKKRLQMEDTKEAENSGFYLNLAPFCSHCMGFEADVKKLNCATLGRDGKRGIINIGCEKRKICNELYRHILKEVEDEKKKQKV